VPYSAKQEKTLRAIEHGWKPKGAFKNVSKGKAAQMLSHGKKKTAAKHLT
jgi:hypothetical protein